jgi:hypothetical protein
VKIITSHHEAGGAGPILHRPLVFLPVELGDGCDVGIGACILPGTTPAEISTVIGLSQIGILVESTTRTSTSTSTSEYQREQGGPE